MTFVNQTDYPDFTQPGQSGSGIIAYTGSAEGDYLGPYYVGNLPAFTLNVQWGSTAGVLYLLTQNSPIALDQVYAQTEYFVPANGYLMDEIKAVAPYVFVQCEYLAPIVQIGASTGGRGSWQPEGGTTLVNPGIFSVASHAAYVVESTSIVPGPIQVTCGMFQGGQPEVTVFDLQAGTLTGILGTGTGPTPNQNRSSVTFECVAGVGQLYVEVVNVAAVNENAARLQVVTRRGY